MNNKEYNYKNEDHEKHVKNYRFLASWSRSHRTPCDQALLSYLYYKEFDKTHCHPKSHNSLETLSNIWPAGWINRVAKNIKAKNIIIFITKTKEKEGTG